MTNKTYWSLQVRFKYLKHDMSVLDTLVGRENNGGDSGEIVFYSFDNVDEADAAKDRVEEAIDYRATQATSVEMFALSKDD